MTWSKSRVDRLGDRLRSESITEDVLNELESYRTSFSEAYRSVEYVLREKLGHEVVGRPGKSTISIVEKLRRQKTRLSQMQDIAGCRVIVKGVREQDSLVYAAEVLLGDVEVDDKRAYAPSGYRAVHVIAKVGGKLVEIQVRTMAQHFWAEFSEKLADLHGQEVKYGGGPSTIRDALDRISSKIASFEGLHSRLVELKTQQLKLRGTPGLKKSKHATKVVEASMNRMIFDINTEIIRAGAYEAKR